MVSAKHILATIAYVAPVLGAADSGVEMDWAVNFYTTNHCNAEQPHWSRVHYAGYNHNNNNQCIVLGDNTAPCGVTYSGTGGPDIPGGVNTYPCTGPNSKGLSGQPLPSYSGGGSCDFYTDTKCTQGHVHHNLASYTGFSGYPKGVCYSGKSLLTQKNVKAFKCTNA